MANKVTIPTKVITGVNTRWSYANVWDPKSINGGAPKYSVSLIIPKSDTATVAKIKAAIQAAYEEGQSKLKGNGKSVPALSAIKTPLRDGDLERPDDEAYKNAYFINATLSCGKLTTGVTIKPWTGIFMLRNLSSPETYFQAAFRVQSPWEITKDNGERQIIKQECYVFDFALDRALRQISDYSCRLNVAESNPEKKVGEFINFLPVLAYDGSAMRQVNAAEILDIAMAGTSATLLAKRWESALLVNVDNDTLARLLASDEAMDALMRIEGFRSLNADIETIINKSNAVKKAKKEGEKLTPKEKKELTEAEKENRCKGCPRRAEHLPRFKSREDFIQFTSFQDTHEDEDGNTVGLDIADPNVNVEKEAILETLFTELVEYLGRISPRYAKIVTLGRQDYSKEQIIAKLGLKPSRGYQEINAAKELTKKFLEL